MANLAEATEKLEWYSHRWKIETFHKVMKSGCQAERS
ncbi:transposase [Enterobacter cloacae]